MKCLDEGADGQRVESVYNTSERSEKQVRKDVARRTEQTKRSIRT